MKHIPRVYFEYQFFSGLDLKLPLDVKIIEHVRDKEISESCITLCFAPIKNLQIMIRQVTELGVNILQPIKTEYTNVILPNTDKLMSYIIGAIEQSGQINLPILKNQINISEISKQYQNIFICDETEKSSAKSICSKNITLIIGPEGGFSKQELQNIEAAHISLGKNILRSDTAAIVALSRVL